MEPAEPELFKLAGWEFDCCANESRRAAAVGAAAAALQVISHRRRLRHKLPPKLAPFAAVKLVKAYAPKVYARRKSWTRHQRRGIYTAAESAAWIFWHIRAQLKGTKTSERSTQRRWSCFSLDRVRCYLARKTGLPRSALRHSTLKRQQTINMSFKRRKHWTAEK